MAAIAGASAIAIGPVTASCFPWSIDMYRGPEVQPFAIAPRVTPADTIPVHGEAPMSLGDSIAKMHNPLEATPQNVAKGRAQFETYCAPCHGTDGQGKGPVAHLLMKSPKNLITGASKNLPDGYIYGAIRDGVLTMPPYAQEIPVEQRWQTVVYLRSMQAAQKNKLAGK